MRISLLQTSLQKQTFFSQNLDFNLRTRRQSDQHYSFFLYIVETSLRSVSAPELQRSTRYNTSALTVTIITWHRVVPV